MKTLDKSLLERATQKLVAEFQPEQIWLFGSHAWGTPDDDSDVDLFVVLRDSDETPIRRAQRAHRCLRGLRMPKDVLVETRQEVDRVKGLKTSLENIILSRGRRLYGCRARVVSESMDGQSVARLGNCPPRRDR